MFFNNLIFITIFIKFNQTYTNTQIFFVTFNLVMTPVKIFMNFFGPFDREEARNEQTSAFSISIMDR